MIFRKSRLPPLPLTMTGVRMGERLLQIGIDDPAIAGELAKKVGLSGVAALVATSERDAERARQAAATAGVLIDVRLTPLATLPFDSGSFDAIVVHAMHGLLAALPPHDRVACLQEARRVLRDGGRIVVIEAGRREGLAGLLRPQKEDPHYAGAGGAVGALTAERFRPVRVLWEREGYKFTEGLKR